MGHFASIYPSCKYTFISGLTRHVVFSHHPKKSKIQSIVGIIICKSVQKAGVIFPTYVYPKAVILTNEKHDIPWFAHRVAIPRDLSRGWTRVPPPAGRSKHVPSRKPEATCHEKKLGNTLQVLNWLFDMDPCNGFMTIPRIAG